jgi:hypothetical protein
MPFPSAAVESHLHLLIRATTDVAPNIVTQRRTVTNQTEKATSPVVIIRWVARVLSVLSVGILLLFFIGEADFSQPVRLTPQEWTGVLLFPAGVVVGMIVAWRREGIGSGIAVGSLLAFYVLDLVTTGTFPSGPFFLLFTSPGILFGVCWLLNRRAQAKAAR